MYKYAEERYFNENVGEYVGYAIIAYDEDGSIIHIPDVFSDESEAKRYVDMFNELQLETIDIYNVLEDIFYEANL